MPVEEFGPYLVYEQIGLGGMASVHRAETQGIGGFRKTVALKRMLPSVAANAEQVKSFIREARLASNLHHTNVAQTYDLGKVGDIYFIAMELVPGRNLREILRHCAKVAGAMPLPMALNILNQICDALDYAHNLCDDSGTPLGIIHRDVSPSNIIVSEGGVVKLIDFGIAKAQGMGMQTQSGTIKGKFGYMAPEYIAGRIDARADLFAIGVIAHELLANRPLFQGKDDMDTLQRVRQMPIDAPSRIRPEVPREIDAIVMTALERDPDRRWQRATALRAALTTETKRLGLVALNHQVVEWLEWAFQQGAAPRDDGGADPSIIIERVEATTSSLATGSGQRLSGALGSTEHPTLPGRPSGLVTIPARQSAQLKTLQGVEPSGPRTLLDASGASASARHSTSGVLRAVEDTAGGVSSVSTKVARKRGGAGRALVFALLVLLVAAATGAVVYFVLPYFT